MKIMLDTNVLISAMVFGGAAARLLRFLLESEHEIIISAYVDAEFHAKLEQKWEKRSNRIYELYRSMGFSFCGSTDQVLCSLRDEKDVPVLSDAIYHHVDYLVTGDKDFLEAGVEDPVILTPAEMLGLLLRAGGA